MDSSTSNTQSIQWDFIADKIRHEQCVLVLGPEVYAHAGNGTSTKEALLKHLDIDNNPNIHQYYPEDEFFLFDESYKRTLVCHQIKSFYDGLKPNDDLLKLAQIPFHIYLTITPDRLLQQAFDEQSFNYQSGFYKRNKEPQLIKSPSRKDPLVYNVFGSVQSEESIILSHDDLFDYFKSIFAQQSMPEKLKLQLQDVKNFIFLGLPFDRWYMHLLLRELEIHNKRYEFTRFAASQSVTSELSTFCLDQFQIQFISKNIQEFIQELHQQFGEAELRQPETDAGGGIGRAKNFLAQGELEKAIEELEDLLEGTDLQDDILQIAGRFSKYQRRVMRGLLSSEDQSLQENNLSNDLLTLIGEAQKLGL
jgi:hypothetical protein